MDILNLLAENLFKIIVSTDCKVCQTIQVDGNDLRGTCHDTACTKTVAEGIVCKFIAEAATRGKGIYRIRHIDKKAVSFAHLLCTEIHKLLVNKSTLTVRKDTCGKYRIRQKFFVSLLAEPLHEEFLKFHKTIHVRLSTIWIVEVAKHLLHVRAVEYRDVPENTLVTTGRRRLIQAIDNTLKLLLDFLCIGLQVVFAILLACKVVKKVKELHCCYSTCKVGCHLIHKVDKGTTERLKVRRSFRDTSHALRTFEQEGI